MSGCSGNCKRANGSTCVCPCGGSSHGTGRIGLALSLIRWARGSRDSTTAEDHRKWTTARERVIDLIDKRIETRRPKKTTKARRTAPTPLRGVDGRPVAEYVRTVRVVRWMVVNPTQRERLETMADSISELGINTLGELEAGGMPRRPAQVRLGDHFWCDAVGSVVVVVEDAHDLERRVKESLEDVVGELAERAWRRLRASRRDADGRVRVHGQPGPAPGASSRHGKDRAAGVDEAILKGAVKGVVRVALDDLTLHSGLIVETTLLRLRMLAVLLCPDPLTHRLVWRHCYLPVARMHIEDELLQELDERIATLDQFVDGGLFPSRSWGPEVAAASSR